jgi:SAM-dependent methyltransferase/uncharacterized protein YbaR (Trm112 family)
MKQELLELMKCPYCGTDFEIDEVYSENEGEIINGYIKCECNEYPILEGILILKNTPTKGYIIEYLKKKEIEKAIALPFGDYTNDICRVMDFIEPKPFGEFFKKSLLSFVNRSSKKRYKRYSDKNLSFSEVLGKGSSNAYFKHRFSSQTFWSLYPFVPLLRKKRKRILDVCCGVGHPSFVISKYVNPDELICVDGEFKSLYLAKKYFSNAEFINIDANYQLPFKDDTFSSVLMMDAFHYVDARILLAKELERVLSKEGMLLLLHHHNALVENVAAGKPLSPLTWRGLFDLDITMLPEKSIIVDFVLRDRLDLSKKYSEEELNLSDAILMIAGADLDCFDGIWKDIFKIEEAVQQSQIGRKRKESRALNPKRSKIFSAKSNCRTAPENSKENLIINPIYKMKEEGNKILLEREFPSEFFRKEFPLTEKYLPERCEIDKRYVNGRRIRVSDSDEIEIADLMRKFVVINVPENYIKT